MLSTKFIPYTTQNLSLSEISSFDPDLERCYIVFWHHRTPLGHLWLDRKIPSDEFSRQAVAAIVPALRHYGESGEKTFQEWLSEIESGQVATMLMNYQKRYSKQSERTISVIICTRNRPEALRRCIDQLLLSEGIDFELVIVDNASQGDDTRKVVAEYKGVKYVREDRKGLDVARNTGIVNASGDIIAFTDDDVTVDRTWISQLRKSFRNPQTMAVTGLVLPFEIQSRAQYIFERDWSFNKGFIPKTFDQAYFRTHLDEGVPAWDIGAGANMAFRKEIFDLAGNFDERLDVGASGCSGDSEFWYRILAEGWNCFYNPELLVLHRHRATMPELRHQLFSYMRGHVSALLVQYERYRHDGNLKRLKRHLPNWYFQRVVQSLKSGDLKHVYTLPNEILGCISGRRFYYRNNLKSADRSFAVPETLNSDIEPDANSLVSVIIPCHNYGRFLPDAITSVRCQSHQAFEIIVVDDGSDDNTSEICMSFPDVRYVKIAHSGVSAARNIGVAHSTGQFLVFLDADDILYREALEINLYFFRYYPEMRMISGAFDVVDEKLELLPPSSEPQQHKEDFYPALLSGNFIGMQSNVMYRRDLFFTFHFDPSLKSCEDYDLNLQISYHLPAFAHKRKVAAYRKHQNNASSAQSAIQVAALKVLGRQREKLRTAAELKALEEGLTNWQKYYKDKTVRTPQEPPAILPLSGSESRPRWSVMIPTYNCYHYIRECLESVLAQNIPPHEMQIAVIDDCSTDGNVAALVEEIGKGRIEFYRQSGNAGSLRNFETCINRAQGEYVHILHGDDRIKPGFYNEIGLLFKQHPTIGAAFSDFEYINHHGEKLYTEAPLMENSGVIPGWLEKISVRQRVQPPAMVIKRAVYEHLGGYCLVHYGEDWEMYVRIAANYPVAHCVKRLAQYRVHSSNITSNSLISGQNVRDIDKVISRVQHYLPEEQRKRTADAARRHFSQYFASISDKIYHEYDSPGAALRQAKMALRMHCNPVTLKFMVKNLVKIAINYRTDAVADRKLSDHQQTVR